jgi:hypothetical protein
MMRRFIVAPAKAGAQRPAAHRAALDSRFRGNDGLIGRKAEFAAAISHRVPQALAVLLTVALGACVQSTVKDPAQPDEAVREGKPLPRFVGVIGAKAQHSPPFLGVPDTNFYCLRSFIDRQTGETQHQLYVSDSYSGAERHWNAARDGEGRSLRFIEIGKNEITCDGGCSYLEEFAAVIPESELRASPRGLTVIFTSRSGAEKRIALSHVQISAQLSAVDRGRNPAQPTAALAAPQSRPPHQ